VDGIDVDVDAFVGHLFPPSRLPLGQCDRQVAFTNDAGGTLVEVDLKDAGLVLTVELVRQAFQVETELGASDPSELGPESASGEVGDEALEEFGSFRSPICALRQAAIRSMMV